jgi:dihydroorotase
MRIRLANAKIFDPSSEFHLQTTNILIEDGVITQIGEIPEGKSIDLKGKIVAPGWVDLFANFNEPGLEHKEDLKSGSAAAANGGFTDVCLIPNTSPVIESKSEVEYIKARSKDVDLWPLGAVSEGLKGENLTEILDLHKHGAVAFTDGTHPIWNSELLLKALQYVQKFDGLIMSRPQDVGLSRHTQMHEGVVSTTLGMTGEPSIAEYITIQRDIEILKYVGGKIHFSQISCERSVSLIKHAKDAGLNVTCDVSINHLIFTENDLESFDTNFKLEPPLRREKDRKALIKGLNNGVIDAICSSHQPHDQECKQLEFDLADFGAIGLQTVYPALLSIQNELPLEAAFEKMSAGPRRVLGLDPVSIEVGSVAKLAIFDPEEEWVLDGKTNKSKSKNSPFIGKKLKGRALGIINKETVSLPKL